MIKSKERAVMVMDITRLYIGDFAIWESDGNGKTNYHYLDKNVLRLNQRQIPVIDIIISNTKQYENSIQSADIAKALNDSGDKSYDKEIVKKIVQAVKKDEKWKEVIEGSHGGYKIKIRDADIDTNTSQELNNDEAKDVVSETQLIAKTKAEESNTVDVADSNSAVTNISRSKIYIGSFVRDKGRVRTFYYEKTPRDVSDVMCMTALVNKDDNSTVTIHIKRIKESGEQLRYIITGPIGSGKSLLARAIAIEVAKAYPKHGLIPILFNLGLFPKSNKSLFEILKDEYESYIPNDDAPLAQSVIKLISPSDFSTHCQQGNVLLIFDGLDELNPDLKEQFMEKLKTFMRNYSKNGILILSRPTGKLIEFESFTVLNLQSLTEEQTVKLIDGFVEPYNSDGKKSFKELILKKQANFLFVPTYLYYNPLYLSIFASRFKKNGYYSIPSLYNTIEAFIKYSSGEDQFNQRAFFSKTSLSPSELREDLAWFCNYLVTHNIDTFDTSIVEKYRREVSDTQSYSTPDFLDDLCRVYGLTRFVDGKYTFIDNVIVEFFYVNYLLKYDRNLFSVRETLDQCHAYTVDNILDMLYETSSSTVESNIYCPYINEFCNSSSDKWYKNYLIKTTPKLSYYVGEGDYEVTNYRYNDIGKHLVRDFKIEQDINHLKFPPVDSLKQRAIYKLSKTNAKKMGANEGLIDAAVCDQEKLKSLKLKPVGYIYSFNVSKILHGQDEQYTPLREILMSEDFPLYIEFDKATTICQNIECGDY